MVPLIVIVFGLIQYGLYFWSYQGGADIARSAARMAAVGDPATCAAFRSRINAQISDIGTPTDSIIHRTYYDTAGTQVTGATAPISVGYTVKVQVEFKTIDLGFPFVPFVNGGWVAQRAEARVDYVPTHPEVSC